MSVGMPVRLTAESAAELCRKVELSDGARLLARDGQTPRELLDLLIDGRQHLDAIRLLAYAMPRREAVWWAISCAKIAHAIVSNENVKAAIEATELWIFDPTDPNRRATMTAAERAGLGTPAGCSCASVFFSGGSLAPPNVPEVPPGDFVTAQLAAAAVQMAAVFTEPEKVSEKHRHFLGLGRKIIDGQLSPPPLSGSEAAAPPRSTILADATASKSAPVGEPAKKSSLFF